MPSYRRLSLIVMALPALLVGALLAFNVATHDPDDILAAKTPFNVDGMAALAARAVYPFGISIDPRGAITGKGGWLFLGDRFQESVSVLRTPATRRERQRAQAAGDNMAAWDAWFRQRGVKDFVIAIAPGKEDVYGDALPGWVAPVADDYQAELRDALAPYALDLAPVIRAARGQEGSRALFRITDTHWTFYAGWLGLEGILDRLALHDPGLVRPAADDVAVGPIVAAPAGDLARFMRLGGALEDYDQGATLANQASNEIELYDFATGELLRTGTDLVVPITRSPTRSQSAGALNQRRVLWLRDSFGEAMSLNIRAVFSDMVVMHYQDATSELLADIVTRFEPEIVLITVADRLTRHAFFRDVQPPAS